MKTMISALVMAIIAAAPTAYESDAAAAWKDYRSFPSEKRLYLRYLSTHSVPEELDAADVLAFWLPHLSSQVVLERQVPVRIGKTKMYRVDLRGLGWSVKSWIALSKLDPYSLGVVNPLILRGDWLVRITADAKESDAYYDLLYQGKTPKTREEFFKFWRINLKDAKGFEQALIIDEGKSGVSIRTRTAVRRRSVTGAGWETFDSREGSGFGDALAQIGGKLDYDASELIASMPKVSIKTGKRSNAQAYLLTDGKGNEIPDADPRIVVDTTDRIPVIRTPGSCVRCHVVGILNPPENAVRAIIKSGVELLVKGADRAEGLERLYLGVIAPEVKEDQGRFAAFVGSVTDKKPEEVVSAYAKLLAWYDAPLSLAQAAIEIDSTAEELKLAIAYYGELGKQSPARLATLAHGRPVPRKIWERQTYIEAIAALKTWRNKR